jgi:hypothetical protein
VVVLAVITVGSAFAQQILWFAGSTPTPTYVSGIKIIPISSVKAEVLEFCPMYDYFDVMLGSTVKENKDRFGVDSSDWPDTVSAMRSSDIRYGSSVMVIFKNGNNIDTITFINMSFGGRLQPMNSARVGLFVDSIMHSTMR